tara:strand:+ start:129 stop:401 length:273 start_codon:yes stop_codon:yes gene_type:complete
MNNTNIITIEKNIPIPKLITGFSRARYKFLKNMDIGDSFVINGNTPDFTPKGVRQYVYSQHSKNNPIRYTVRTLSGPNDKPTAIRVWRVK